jgi:hypothetical protein
MEKWGNDCLSHEHKEEIHIMVEYEAHSYKMSLKVHFLDSLWLTESGGSMPHSHALQ